MGTWETGLARCRTSFGDKALHDMVTSPLSAELPSNARNPRSLVEEQSGAGVSRDPTPPQAISGAGEGTDTHTHIHTRDSRDPEIKELSEPGSLTRVRGRRKNQGRVAGQPAEGSEVIGQREGRDRD